MILMKVVYPIIQLLYFFILINLQINLIVYQAFHDKFFEIN